MIGRALGVGKLAAYVGVPASTAKDRSEQLLDLAGRRKGKRRAYLEKSAKQDVNNAELLFIHTMGSPARHIPARPVLQPAVDAQDNKEKIVRELGGMVKAQLGGDREGAERFAGRAALAGQNAARKWFTDPRNAWAPNKESTIARKNGLTVAQVREGLSKGTLKDKPLIDTGALRTSIQGIVAEE